MFKKPSSATPAEQRLFRAAGKRIRMAKAQRAYFLAQIKSTQPSEASTQKADELVQRVRAAKGAPFLQQYRITD